MGRASWLVHPAVEANRSGRIYPAATTSLTRRCERAALPLVCLSRRSIDTRLHPSGSGDRHKASWDTCLDRTLPLPGQRCAHPRRGYTPAAGVQHRVGQPLARCRFEGWLVASSLFPLCLVQDARELGIQVLPSIESAFDDAIQILLDRGEIELVSVEDEIPSVNPVL